MPVRLLGGASFLHLRAGDVHVLAVTRDNVNAMLSFSFMVKVRIRGLFGGGEDEKREGKNMKEKPTSTSNGKSQKNLKKKLHQNLPKTQQNPKRSSR